MQCRIRLEVSIEIQITYSKNFLEVWIAEEIHLAKAVKIPTALYYRSSKISYHC